MTIFCGKEEATEQMTVTIGKYFLLQKLSFYMFFFCIQVSVTEEKIVGPHEHKKYHENQTYYSLTNLSHLDVSFVEDARGSEDVPPNVKSWKNKVKFIGQKMFFQKSVHKTDRREY